MPSVVHATMRRAALVALIVSMTPMLALAQSSTSTPVGVLTADQIRATIWRNISQMQHCYEQLLQRRADAEGRVTVAFTIHADGFVSDAEVVNDTIGDVAMGRCVATATSRLRFPPPDPAGDVTVRFPFNFTESDGSSPPPPPRAATPGPAPRDGASARPPRSPYPDERSAARESARSGGFLRALHSLPKPILFGMYGAVGGLLAALLLGELFWFLLRPAAASPLTAAVSDKVALYPGATNRFTVKIARSGFSGPVNVKVVGLPTDVTASSATIPADKSEAEIEINATPLVALGGHSLKVEVSAPDVPDATRTEAIHLNVEAMPPSVVLAVSPTVSVYAGDRNRFAAHLKRFLFKGAVQLELLDAPAGIILDPVVIGEESDKAELSIGVTDAKAPARVVPLKLQARALDAGGPKTVQTFNLKIEPIPPSLAVKASPSVTVYAGEKNRFAVKLARYWFDGMVRVEAADLPSDVKIGSILVPADKADAEMEIVAEKSAALGQTQIRLIATAIGADAIARENTLVKVEPVPPTVSMTLSPAVTVYAGEKNKFAVKIARQRFDGPVIIESSGTLPPGVRVPSVTIPAGAGEAEMEIFQGYGDPAGAAEREVKIKLQARALDPRVPRSIEDLSLKVITLPAKMQVAVSPLVEVYQGGRCRFTVKVARSGFEGPVRLSFADLPDGVGIDTTLLPAGLSEMEVEGAALAKAATGKKMVNLTAVGPDGRNPVAKSEFNLDVKPTDPSKLPPPLDIVFALDTTGSMEFAISGVRTGIERFIEELQKNQLEARVALLSFKDLIEDPKEEAMKIIKFKGSTFTTDFNLFKNEVGKLRADGGGVRPEGTERCAEPRKVFRLRVCRVCLPSVSRRLLRSASGSIRRSPP